MLNGYINLKYMVGTGLKLKDYFFYIKAGV